MKAHSPNAVVLTMRVIIKNSDQDDQESLDAALVEFRRLLLHRLKVLEAAMQRVAELRRAAADAPPSVNEQASITAPPPGLREP